MEHPSSTTSQELIDRAGELFHERREPKFPSVREKLLNGIVKPDAQLFLASFDHLNPAYPSRIITGKLRADGIVEALQSEKVEGVSVMLDLLAPSSDRQNEGGGWSLGLGIVPDKLTRILRDPDVFYANNELLALDQEPVLRAFTTNVRDALQSTDLTADERAMYETRMTERLGATLGLYNLAVNEAMRRGLSGSVAIQELRTIVEASLRLDTQWIKEVLQSTMLGNISDALEEMARLAFPFWQMPNPGQEPFLRFVTKRGTEGGSVRHDGEAFQFVDHHGRTVRTVPENAIFDLMRRGEVIPRTNLLLFASATAPEIPHFGNTYGLEQASADWLQVQGSRLKIETDFHNSIPLGHVAISGQKSRSLLTLGMLRFPREQLRQIIQDVARTGKMPTEEPFGKMNERS